MDAYDCDWITISVLAEAIDLRMPCVFSQAPREKDRLRPSALGVLLRCRALTGFRLSGNLLRNERKKVFPNLPKKHACGTREQPSLAPSGCVS